MFKERSLKPFTELRRLENVEMLSVTPCVERRRCRCGFSCFEFQTIVSVQNLVVAVDRCFAVTGTRTGEYGK